MRYIVTLNVKLATPAAAGWIGEYIRDCIPTKGPCCPVKEVEVITEKRSIDTGDKVVLKEDLSLAMEGIIPAGSIGRVLDSRNDPERDVFIAFDNPIDCLKEWNNTYSAPITSLDKDFVRID